MVAFQALLKANLVRRLKDGFAVGYNVVFPLILIGLLGFLCKNSYRGGIVTGYQYYGVVIIPFCIFLSIITAAYAGKDDAYANTADRILIAPISYRSIVTSKILAETIVFSSCSLLVLLVSSLIWKVCKVTELLPIGVLYVSITFFITSIGTYIGLGMKDFMKIKNVINVPVMIFAMLGGCFFRFGTFDKEVQFVLNLSPLTWINRSIFYYIYDGSVNTIFVVCGILLMIGLIFACLAIICFNKEEYGHGELPSYDK